MSDKTEKIKKKLDAQKSALDILQSLNGKHIDLMSKAEQEALLIALAQLAGVAWLGVDDKQYRGRYPTRLHQ